jgi:hypothetical protein
VNAFNLAYSRAITVNQTHFVRLDRNTRRYFVERPAREGEGGSGFVLVRDVAGGQGEIDARISIQIRKRYEESSVALGQGASSVSENDTRKQNRDQTLAFYPDGTGEAAEIVLRDRHGFRLALRINPTSARVHIVELERE